MFSVDKHIIKGVSKNGKRNTWIARSYVCFGGIHPHLNFLSSRSLSECISIQESRTAGSGSLDQKLGKLRVHLLKTPSHLGHFSSRVNRPGNEDRYNASVLNLPGKRVIFNYNIFDGHGGDQCSNFLKENLSREVENASELCSQVSDQAREDLAKKYWKNIGGYWKRWYKHREEVFAKYFNKSEEIELSKIPHEDDLRSRVPLAFLNADYNFFSQKDNNAGSTCTSVFIETIYKEENKEYNNDYYFNSGTISKLTVAQVGDTKAILVDKNGIANPITQIHHPSNALEAKRLRKYAANFFITDSFGEERFIALANTRAFGDIKYKQVGVTAEPEISQFIIGDGKALSNNMSKSEIERYTINGLGGDEAFLILCSDGVTDILTDQEIADIVMVNFNLKGQPKATVQYCSEEVIHFVEYVGGDDNSTCLVIRLGGWGKWPILDRTGELRQERLDDSNRMPPR